MSWKAKIKKIFLFQKSIGITCNCNSHNRQWNAEFCFLFKNSFKRLVLVFEKMPCSWHLTWWWWLLSRFSWQNNFFLNKSKKVNIYDKITEVYELYILHECATNQKWTIKFAWYVHLLYMFFFLNNIYRQDI